MRESRKHVFWVVFALVLASAGAVRAADYRIGLLQAMKQELTRNHKKLQLPNHRSPYFISYTLRHHEYRNLEARTGAVFSDRNVRYRKIDIDLRVGDYGFDNSLVKEPDLDTFDFYQPTTSAPLSNEPKALRRQLWLLTDFHYKRALTNYLKLKGKRVFNTGKKQTGGVFSRQKPARYIAPAQQLTFDKAYFTGVVRRVSRILSSNPLLFDSKVEATARKLIRIFVSTEGSEVITERMMYAVSLFAATRAEDGMLIKDSVVLYGLTHAELPSEKAIVDAARVLAKNLLALRTAPVLPPFNGPAILEPKAAGVFIHETLGHRLEGHRNLGDKSGQTFKDKIGKVILPLFLTVIDDPTQRLFKKRTLNGYYRYDAQGVKSQPVTLVEKGVLKRFLMSRRPVAPFMLSNGHGRSAGSRRATARMGNLIIRSSLKVPYPQLRKMLLQEVRKQKKPFGLIIRNITGGSTNTTAYGYQAFKGIPKMVYKIDARTGKETLVRGVEFVGTPLTSLNKIVATSAHYGAFNGYCGAESGYVPVSTVAPAMLFREIELQRSLKKKERGLLLPPP